jgi:hypothetical protein
MGEDDNSIPNLIYCSISSTTFCFCFCTFLLITNSINVSLNASILDKKLSTNCLINEKELPQSHVFYKYCRYELKYLNYTSLTYDQYFCSSYNTNSSYSCLYFKNDPSQVSLNDYSNTWNTTVVIFSSIFTLLSILSCLLILTIFVLMAFCIIKVITSDNKYGYFET